MVKGSEHPELLKYDKDAYPKQARKLCLLGATNVEMADFFEVNPDTIYEWMKNYPDFKNAVLAGKMAADAEVAEALFNRAKGFTHKDVKMFVSEGTILTEEYDKYIVPDTKAASWWLNNRRLNWADKKEIAVTTPAIDGVTESIQDKLDEIFEPNTGE